MDRKTKILGSIHVILGGGGIAACVAAYLNWIRLASDAHSLRTAHTLGQMAFMLSVFILLPSFLCGVGLLLNKSWGRVVAMGVSMLLMLVIPIGTLLGGYGLWVLLKQPQQSPQPPKTAAAGHLAGSRPSPHTYHPHDIEPPKTSWLLAPRQPFSSRAGLLLVMVISGASMIVLLRAGFWLAGQRPPSVIVEPLHIAGVLLLAIVVALIVLSVRGGRSGSTAATLAATPAPTHSTSAAPSTAHKRLCAHLQLVAQAMRNVAISFTGKTGNHLQANWLGRAVRATHSLITQIGKNRMNHLKIRLFAVALVVIGAGLVYVNWQDLLHAHKYSTKVAAFAPLCLVAGLFLIAFPGFSGKPNTTKEKLVGALVFVIGLLAGLLNWYWMDPGFFGR